jgi:hypothetical protein
MPKPQKSYRQKIREIFYRVKIHPYYQKIMSLPFWMRMMLAIFLFCFGVIGLLTPIPAGWLMITTA